MDYFSVQDAFKNVIYLKGAYKNFAKKTVSLEWCGFVVCWLVPKGAEKLVDGRLKINMKQDGDE